ncbi:MAG TPA: hypothetical protein VND80_03215 [Steroidobacteraceae bacterium]|nr:hypothetical protein [Steroidobacteraceae bacterium]
MIRRSFIGIACAGLASIAAIAVAAAAVIDGNITFPGSDEPAVTVYVYALGNSRLRTEHLRSDQRAFRLVVPPARYVVFAAPSEAGAPDVYGAYTHCSGALPQALPACSDHRLRTVVIDPKTRRADVALDDWYLSDALADALDRIRGIAATPGPQPEGAPRFSEYPTAPNAAGGAAPPKPHLRSLALTAADRATLRDVAAAGPNFAGTLTAAVANCGAHCLHVLLLDWCAGKVIEAPQLAAVDDDLPCRTREAVLFRRDSRLFSVTRMRGGLIATQYFLWDPTSASLSLLAVYPRKESEFCAIDPS